MLHTFGQPEATCGKTLVGVGQGLKMVKFLLQHFRMLQDAARVLPTPSQHLQHDPTMLQDVSLKCCLRLAGLYNAAKRHFGLPKRHL